MGKIGQQGRKRKSRADSVKPPVAPDAPNGSESNVGNKINAGPPMDEKKTGGNKPGPAEDTTADDEALAKTEPRPLAKSKPDKKLKTSDAVPEKVDLSKVPVPLRNPSVQMMIEQVQAAMLVRQRFGSETMGAWVAIEVVKRLGHCAAFDDLDHCLERLDAVQQADKSLPGLEMLRWERALQKSTEKQHAGLKKMTMADIQKQIQVTAGVSEAEAYMAALESLIPSGREVQPCTNPSSIGRKAADQLGSGVRHHDKDVEEEPPLHTFVMNMITAKLRADIEAAQSKT